MSVLNPINSVNEPTSINNNKIEMVPLLTNNTAPIATSELDDDLDDDREIVKKPYPGIDDGFFDNKNNVTPEVETIDLNKPKLDIPDIDITPATPDIDMDVTPSIFTRFGDDSNKPDTIDGATPHDGTATSFGPLSPPYKPQFPGFDIEGGSTFGDSNIPDVNIYQHKKTLAQGMMDLALFSANANQLRYVVESRQHPYFYPSVILISFSLMVQVAVGIGLIWNATYNVKDHKEIHKANRINNFTVIGIFLVTVVNVFISAFGVASPAATVPTTAVVVAAPGQ